MSNIIIIIDGNEASQASAGVTIVADIAARDAIIAGDRSEGMTVLVQDASSDVTVSSGAATYVLKSGLTNSDWQKTGEGESLDLTAASLGLGNVDNTSDTNKPVSTAQQTALDGKSNTSHTHSYNTDDISESLTKKYVSTSEKAQIADSFQKSTDDLDDINEGTTNKAFTSTLKSKLDNIEANAEVNTVTSVASKTGAVSLVKADVGLGNVDNTSDANKPVSSATQTALDGKSNTSHTHSYDTDDISESLTKKYVSTSEKAQIADSFQKSTDDLDDINEGATNKAFTSTLKSKLDNIEANADVTDATNVNSAGAVMNTDTTTASMSFVVDEDDFSSDSATKVATQQSTKAYVDANAGATILTAKVESDVSITGFDDYSSDLVNLTLPVGTYAYKGTLILYSSDYMNRGLQCDVYNSGAGTFDVDGFWGLRGKTASSGTSIDTDRYKHMNGNTKITDINISSGGTSSFYGKVEVEGLITVTTADATLSIKVGKDNGDSSTVTIYKGSVINFIKQ